MDVYPVKLTQEAISVNVSGAARTVSSPSGKGGADSSVDNNNVFSDDSRPYYEGQDPLSKLLSLGIQNPTNRLLVLYVFGGQCFEAAS